MQELKIKRREETDKAGTRKQIKDLKQEDYYNLNNSINMTGVNHELLNKV